MAPEAAAAAAEAPPARQRKLAKLSPVPNAAPTPRPSCIKRRAQAALGSPRRRALAGARPRRRPASQRLTDVLQETAPREAMPAVPAVVGVVVPWLATAGADSQPLLCPRLRNWDLSACGSLGGSCSVGDKEVDTLAAAAEQQTAPSRAIGSERRLARCPPSSSAAMAASLETLQSEALAGAAVKTCQRCGALLQTAVSPARSQCRNICGGAVGLPATRSGCTELFCHGACDKEGNRAGSELLECAACSRSMHGACPRLAADPSDNHNCNSCRWHSEQSDSLWASSAPMESALNGALPTLLALPVVGLDAQGSAAAPAPPLIECGWSDEDDGGLVVTADTLDGAAVTGSAARTGATVGDRCCHGKQAARPAAERKGELLALADQQLAVTRQPPLAAAPVSRQVEVSAAVPERRRRRRPRRLMVLEDALAAEVAAGAAAPLLANSSSSSKLTEELPCLGSEHQLGQPKLQPAGKAAAAAQPALLVDDAVVKVPPRNRTICTRRKKRRRRRGLAVERPRAKGIRLVSELLSGDCGRSEEAVGGQEGDGDGGSDGGGGCAGGHCSERPSGGPHTVLRYTPAALHGLESCSACGGLGEYAVEEFVACADCGEAFHAFCLEPPLRATPELRAFWRCKACKICETCGVGAGGGGGHADLLVCSICDQSHHAACLPPRSRPSAPHLAGTYGWPCPTCCTCVRCGASLGNDSEPDPPIETCWLARSTVVCCSSCAPAMEEEQRRQPLGGACASCALPLVSDNGGAIEEEEPAGTQSKELGLSVPRLLPEAPATSKVTSCKGCGLTVHAACAKQERQAREAIAKAARARSLSSCPERSPRPSSELVSGLEMRKAVTGSKGKYFCKPCRERGIHLRVEPLDRFLQSEAEGNHAAVAAIAVPAAAEGNEQAMAEGKKLGVLSLGRPSESNSKGCGSLELGEAEATVEAKQSIELAVLATAGSAEVELKAASHPMEAELPRAADVDEPVLLADYDGKQAVAEPITAMSDTRFAAMVLGGPPLVSAPPCAIQGLTGTSKDMTGQLPDAALSWQSTLMGRALAHHLARGATTSSAYHNPTVIGQGLPAPDALGASWPLAPVLLGQQQQQQVRRWPGPPSSLWGHQQQQQQPVPSVKLGCTPPPMLSSARSFREDYGIMVVSSEATEADGGRNCQEGFLGNGGKRIADSLRPVCIPQQDTSANRRRWIEFCAQGSGRVQARKRQRDASWALNEGPANDRPNHLPSPQLGDRNCNSLATPQSAAMHADMLVAGGGKFPSLGAWLKAFQRHQQAVGCSSRTAAPQRLPQAATVVASRQCAVYIWQDPATKKHQSARLLSSSAVRLPPSTEEELQRCHAQLLADASQYRARIAASPLKPMTPSASQWALLCHCGGSNQACQICGSPVWVRTVGTVRRSSSGEHPGSKLGASVLQVFVEAPPKRPPSLRVGLSLPTGIVNAQEKPRATACPDLPANKLDTVEFQGRLLAAEVMPVATSCGDAAGGMPSAAAAAPRDALLSEAMPAKELSAREKGEFLTRSSVWQQAVCARQQGQDDLAAAAHAARALALVGETQATALARAASAHVALAMARMAAMPNGQRAFASTLPSHTATAATEVPQQGKSRPAIPGQGQGCTPWGQSQATVGAATGACMPSIANMDSEKVKECQFGDGRQLLSPNLAQRGECTLGLAPQALLEDKGQPDPAASLLGGTPPPNATRLRANKNPWGKLDLSKASATAGARDESNHCAASGLHVKNDCAQGMADSAILDLTCVAVSTNQDSSAGPSFTVLKKLQIQARVKKRKITNGFSPQAGGQIPGSKEQRTEICEDGGASQEDLKSVQDAHDRLGVLDKQGKPSKEEGRDVRRCLVCSQAGTQHGRMVYCGPADCWLHAGCVLWCPGIVRSPGGEVKRVAEAVSRMQSADDESCRCGVCKLPGASVPCAGASCSRKPHVHFTCAKALGMVFLAGGSVLCRKHATRARLAGQKVLSFDLVGRRARLYVTPASPRHNLLAACSTAASHTAGIADEEFRSSEGSCPPLKMTAGKPWCAEAGPAVLAAPSRAVLSHWMRVGAVCVRQLGEVVALPRQKGFVSRDHIFPLGYQAFRLHWSVLHVGVRALYRVEVQDTPAGCPWFVLTLVREVLPPSSDNGGSSSTVRSDAEVNAATGNNGKQDVDGTIAASSADELWRAFEERLWVLRQSAGLGWRRRQRRARLALSHCKSVAEVREDAAQSNQQEPSAFQELRVSTGAACCGAWFFGLHVADIASAIEQLPDVEMCLGYKFRHRQQPAAVQWRNPSGCARSEPHWSRGVGRVGLDVAARIAATKIVNDKRLRRLEAVQAGWEEHVTAAGSAAGSGVHPACASVAAHSTGGAGQAGSATFPGKGATGQDTIVEVPLSMRYRAMRKDLRKRVAVGGSSIHGRGLFALIPFSPSELVIEYVGELIRTSISDLREKNYQQQGLGCYFFGLPKVAGVEDLVLDATRQGNAARHINHSCDGNLFARALVINGHRKLLIFAHRSIDVGEELTLNYMFAAGDPAHERVPCLCGHQYCRGYL
eukprot:SM000035S13062  [mRNA]  locus=s35:239531:249005:+ [translate_table: standard]